MTTSPRLTRNTDDKMIAGVASGLADHFGLDPTLVRIGFVLLGVFGGSGVLLYLALWLIIPSRDAVDADPQQVFKAGLTEVRDTAHRVADDVRDVFGKGDQQPPSGPQAPPSGSPRPPQDDV